MYDDASRSSDRSEFGWRAPRTLRELAIFTDTASAEDERVVGRQVINGASCCRAGFMSMSPLERVEEQGGEQEVVVVVNRGGGGNVG